MKMALARFGACRLPVAQARRICRGLVLGRACTRHAALHSPIFSLSWSESPVRLSFVKRCVRAVSGLADACAPTPEDVQPAHNIVVAIDKTRVRVPT